MKYSRTIIKSVMILFGVFSVHGQELDTSKWRWRDTSKEDVVLYIGNDTISKNVWPITQDKQWWEAFGYPTLDTLESKALEQNLDLKIALAKLNQARANKHIAMSTMFPTIRVEPSFTRQEFSANRPNPFGGQLGPATLSTYQAPVTASYELDVFGKNLNNFEANNLVYKATEENRKQILLEVTTEVAGNYFLLVRLDAEIDLLKHTEKTRLDNLEIASTRYNAGLVSQIDELRAKTELASVQVQLKNTQRLRSEIELILATLVGEDASTFEVPHANIQYLPPNVEFLRKDSLVVTRPDLRASKLMIESAEKMLVNQKKQLLPSFQLSGAYGYLSGDSDNLIERDSRTWFAGVTASLPVFEGGKKRAEIKLRKSELEEEHRNYEQNLLQSYRQVENAFSNLHWIREQLLAQQEFVVAARDAALLTNERYRKGLVNYIDVVDAERQVLEAERLSVQLFGQELTERVNLIRSMALDSGRLEN
ncbi:efflux transporter outer membrane subunit [Flagellimonas sediminis]|uniref:Efflux transporter outer membrane subunit n=1 Tax=Flagellimonas sediminis TaxID=2696468 RepID=A0A6I5KRM7_9FLAO|nr:efflux transporter outer membrane subunit [Allomuricauda sediminis]NDV42595.1 efflux transporter outer membrane subunit [Allomuricauda sediminis]